MAANGKHRGPIRRPYAHRRENERAETPARDRRFVIRENPINTKAVPSNEAPSNIATTHSAPRLIWRVICDLFGDTKLDRKATISL